MKKISKHSRLSELEIRKICRDLTTLYDGEIGFKFTWESLAQRYGFSRQSLQANNEIKLLYKKIKFKFSPNNKIFNKENKNTTVVEVDKIIQENRFLKSKIELHQKKEEEWLLRWQKIAYNLYRLHKTYIHEMDNNQVIKNSDLPNLKETDEILSKYTKD